MRTSMRMCGGLVLAAGLLMLIGFQGRQIAEAACTIAWLVSDETCDVAHNSSGDFSYQLETQWASQYEGPWTLVQNLTPSVPHNNVSNPEEDNDSTEVGDDYPNSSLMFSDDIPTTCTGRLTSPTLNGSATLSGWNADTFNCAGGRTVTIKPNTGACP